MAKFKTIRGGKPIEVSGPRLKQMDAEQERRRVYPEELEGFVGALTALQILNDAIPDLSQMLKETNTNRKVKPALKLLANGLIEASGRMSLVQLNSLQSNLRNTKISISSWSDPVDNTTTIGNTQLGVLTDATMEWCRANCIKTGDECKQCDIREALDATFCCNSKRLIRGGDFCPYLMQRDVLLRGGQPT